MAQGHRVVDLNAGIRYVSIVIPRGDEAALFADQLSVFAPKGPLLVPRCRGVTLDRKMANASAITFDPRSFFWILVWDRAVVSLWGYPVTCIADGGEAWRLLAAFEIIGSHTDT